MDWSRIGAVTGVLVFAAGIALWVATEGVFGIDFEVFRQAGELVGADDWAGVYDPDVFRARLGVGNDSLTYFISPPPFAWAMQPLAALPAPLALGLWHLFGVVAFVASARTLGLPDRWLLPLAVMPAVVYNFALGQSGLFFLAAAVGVHRLVVSDRRVLAGLLAGVFILKPPLAIGLALWWLVDLRRWWPTVVAAGASAAMLVVPTLGDRGESWELYWQVLQGRVDDEATWNVNSMSLAEFLKLLAPNVTGLTAVFWIVALVVGGAATIAAGRRWPLDVEIRSAAAMLITVGVSPHLSIYDTGLLIIPVAVVAARASLRLERIVALYAGSLAFAPLLYKWQYDVIGRGSGLEFPALVAIAVILARSVPVGADLGSVDRERDHLIVGR